MYFLSKIIWSYFNPFNLLIILILISFFFRLVKYSFISKFFSYLVVLIISFITLVILVDTLKVPLINNFPRLEIILFNLFEILKDIKLFIIDLY